LSSSIKLIVGFLLTAIGGTCLVYGIPAALGVFLMSAAGAALGEGKFAATAMQAAGLAFGGVIIGSLLCGFAWKILKGSTENGLILVGFASLMTIGVVYSKFDTNDFIQFVYGPVIESNRPEKT
jgi:hypothetical protein